jgi:hypothetical protein
MGGQPPRLAIDRVAEPEPGAVAFAAMKWWAAAGRERGEVLPVAREVAAAVQRAVDREQRDPAAASAGS